MSFFSSSYKPQAQIRQEGFHLPDPTQHSPSSTPPPPPTNPNNFDIFNPFLSDYRKFPSAGEGTNSMDFGDELASLMNQQQHSNERGTQSPQPNPQPTSEPSPVVIDNGTTMNGDNSSTTNYDDSGAYRPQTHNIFDISAPLASSSQSGAESYTTQTSAPNFNSMRYDLFTLTRISNNLLPIAMAPQMGEE
jgi:hypothetical protein